MTSTAHDYGWLRDCDWFRSLLSHGYSLTLVRGWSPQDVLDLLDAVPQGAADGIDDLFDCHTQLRAWVDDHQDASFTAGAVTVPGTGGAWTLVLALDSGVGLTGQLLTVLSAGGTAVEHVSNSGKPVHTFHYFEDGELRTAFEVPEQSWGSDPDALTALLHDVGYHRADGLYERKAAVFALAERLTGVRLTDELVRDAGYELGVVADESGD